MRAGLLDVDHIHHTQRLDALYIDALLHSAVHALEVPTDDLPADVQCDALALHNHAGAQPSKLGKVLGRKHRIRKVLGDEQPVDRLALRRRLFGERANHLGGAVRTEGDKERVAVARHVQMHLLGTPVVPALKRSAQAAHVLQLAVHEDHMLRAHLVDEVRVLRVVDVCRERDVVD